MPDKIPNVLVVDDAREMRESLVRYLQKNGLRAVGAENAIAARKLFRTNIFDLVILDILMPGEDGLSFYVRNRFPGLNTFDPIQFFALAAALLVLALGLSSMIVRARFGMALRATRANPARAVAVGIRPFGIRLAAFVLSGMLTGLAGALYADLNRFVSPAMLSWHMSGEIMVFVILGGVGRLMGPVAGAGAYIVLEHLLGGVSDHWQALLGVLLILIVLRAPGGIVGTLRGGDGR